jgi:hypothetical protein
VNQGKCQPLRNPDTLFRSQATHLYASSSADGQIRRYASAPKSCGAGGSAASTADPDRLVEVSRWLLSFPETIGDSMPHRRVHEEGPLETPALPGAEMAGSCGFVS